MKKILFLGFAAIAVFVFLKKSSETSVVDIPQDLNKAVEDVSLISEEKREVVVEGGNFFFSPNVLNFQKGEEIRLVFKSVGGTHDFVVEGTNIKTKRISDGSSIVIEFKVPEESGSYDFYCSIGNHRAMGMVGKMVVK